MKNTKIAANNSTSRAGNLTKKTENAGENSTSSVEDRPYQWVTTKAKANHDANTLIGHRRVNADMI